MAEKRLCPVCEDEINEDGSPWLIYDPAYEDEQHRFVHATCFLRGDDEDFLSDVTERLEDLLILVAKGVDAFREDEGWDFANHSDVADAVRAGMSMVENAVRKLEASENQIRQECGDEPIDRTALPRKRLKFIDDGEPIPMPEPTKAVESPGENDLEFARNIARIRKSRERGRED